MKQLRLFALLMIYTLLTLVRLIVSMILKVVFFLSVCLEKLADSLSIMIDEEAEIEKKEEK